MVLIHIKRNDESQFLIDTNRGTPVEQLVKNVVTIFNGRLKVERICCEMEELAKYGTLYPPEILGLTEEQVSELKLDDHWGEQCIPSGGFTFVKDPIGRRNGKQPKKEMQDVLTNTVKEAKAMISKKLVTEGKCLTAKMVQNAIELLKGAVMIVYPMKLPPHDVIRMEFENIEDLAGTQASKEVIDPMAAQLWFCGRELYTDGKTVGDYVGKIENCKVIMKLSMRGSGAPGREPVMNENERKQWMLQAYRRQEELKKLDADDDDSYLNSEWADSGNLKRSFHGISNISWRVGK
ncbi:cilia- and flagella-associated protein 298 [Photinus pyralis]|nr:cilia- and flagella-associated protein 298 [Photinus pyralis]